MANSDFAEIDGIRTHFWTAGDSSKPPLVLLHGGEFGGAAELSFERNFDALAEHFYVLAPDMLGFGLTAKIFEFGLVHRYERRIWHIRRFLDHMGVTNAHFVGNSLGGYIVLNDLVSDRPALPVASLTSICGCPPYDDHARNILTSFDGTAESMRSILGLLFTDPVWQEDAYVERKRKMALIPGAYEAAAAARLTVPNSGPVAPPSPRHIQFEKIAVNCLFIEGKYERASPGFSEKAAAAVQNGKFALFEHSSHCAQLEEPEAFHKALFDFLGI